MTYTIVIIFSRTLLFDLCYSQKTCIRQLDFSFFMHSHCSLLQPSPNSKCQSTGSDYRGTVTRGVEDQRIAMELCRDRHLHYSRGTTHVTVLSLSKHGINDIHIHVCIASIGLRITIHVVNCTW